eukprot:TRINITY_DN1203_c0_g1_i5.p1 TRINITY_DN1203_c0_g1~~TRINITY_DN1203_c0_g1_i5.p1  ORF type:complete len:504 (+),score=75.00 TRINITY_DN1203_c0_g1_i5:28-1512(+)
MEPPAKKSRQQNQNAGHADFSTDNDRVAALEAESAQLKLTVEALSNQTIQLSNQHIAANEEIARLQRTVEELERRMANTASEGPSRAPASEPAQAEAVVRLNVGGTPYSTARSTLTKFRDSMLGAMFSGQFALNTDRDGQVFIDRDGELFAPVLSFLRTGRWALPTDSPLLVEHIRREAEYFGLPWPEEVIDLATLSPIRTVSIEDGLSRTARLEDRACVGRAVVFRDRLVASCTDNVIRVYSGDGIFLRSLLNDLPPYHIRSSENLLIVWSRNKIRMWNSDFDRLPDHALPEDINLLDITEWLGWLACNADSADVILLDLADRRVSGSLAGTAGSHIRQLHTWNRTLVVVYGASPGSSRALRVWDEERNVRHELKVANYFYTFTFTEKLYVVFESGDTLKAHAYSADNFRPVLERQVQLPFDQHGLGEWEGHLVAPTHDSLLVYDENCVCQWSAPLPSEARSGSIAAGGSTLAIVAAGRNIVFWRGQRRICAD